MLGERTSEGSSWRCGQVGGGFPWKPSLFDHGVIAKLNYKAAILCSTDVFNMVCSLAPWAKLI